MSGIGLFQFDIGGHQAFNESNFRMVRSKELLLRSAEYAVFTPIMKTTLGN